MIDSWAGNSSEILSFIKILVTENTNPEMGDRTRLVSQGCVTAPFGFAYSQPDALSVGWGGHYGISGLKLSVNDGTLVRTVGPG
jgi:hypothetical protein